MGINKLISLRRGVPDRGKNPHAIGIAPSLLLIALSLFVSSCSNSTDNTHAVASVYVSRPQVYTKERLVSQRLADVQWMQGQLKTDPAASFQGHLSTQTLTQVQELVTATITPTATPTAPAATAPTSNTAGVTGLPSLSSIPSTSSTNTAIDQFNDLKARRDAINGAILNESLDDAHDLLGNTIYILKIDVATSPDQRVDRALLVSFTIAGPFDGTDKTAPSEQDKIAMYQGWRNAMVERVAREAMALEIRDWADQLTLQQNAEMRENLARAHQLAEARAKSGKYNLQPQSDQEVSLWKAYYFDNLLQKDQRGITRSQSTPSASDAQPSESKVPKDRAIQDASRQILDPRAFGEFEPSAEPLSQLSQPAQSADEKMKGGEVPGGSIAAVPKPGKKNETAADRQNRKEQWSYAFCDVVSVIAKYSGSGFDDLAQLAVTPESGGNLFGVVPLPLDDDKLLCNACAFYDRLVAAQKNGHGAFEAKAYVTAVDPSEYVQNISAVAGMEAVYNTALSLSAVLGHSGNIGSNTSYLHASEQLMDSITRNPLVVGFADGESRFGWLLGPKFKLKKGGGAPDFQQAVNRYTVSATVVVPAWWPALRVTKTCAWVNRDGSMTPIDDSVRSFNSSLLASPYMLEALGHPVPAHSRDIEAWGPTREIPVNLPADWSRFLDYSLGGYGRYEHRPVIDTRVQKSDRDGLQACPIAVLREGQKNATLLISGRDLWRNPMVFIGSQMADSVQVTPDMKGIVATFASVGEPSTRNFDRSVDLIVSTSDGSDAIPGGVLILPPKTDPASPAAFVNPPNPNFVVAGAPATFVTDPGKFPLGYVGFVLGLKPTGFTEPTTITDPDPLVKSDGTQITLTLAKPASPPAWWSTPQEVSVDFLVKLRPTDTGNSVLIGGPHKMVFFASADQAQLVLSGSPVTFDHSAAPLPPNAFTITFPSAVGAALFKEAYSGLDAALTATPLKAVLHLADKAKLLPPFDLSITLSGDTMLVSSTTVTSTSGLIPAKAGTSAVYDNLSFVINSLSIPVNGTITLK